METFFFVMALAWGCWNFILRRMYKHRSEMFEAEVKRMHKKKRVEVELNYLERQN